MPRSDHDIGPANLLFLIAVDLCGQGGNANTDGTAWMCLLWGVMMTFLSMLPAIGTAFVWVPAAIWLFLTGAWVKGLILVLVGVLIIGLIDNLLRPQLIGKETRLPDYLILISTVGGISLIGINGFVVGPLIAALFIAAWSLFVQQQNARKPESTDSNAV